MTKHSVFFPGSPYEDVEVTKDDIHLYHNIDRLLFYRLVHDLCRYVNESMHIVAFFLWLERVRYSHNAVFKVLRWPDQLLTRLANEVVALLRYLESDRVTHRVFYRFTMLSKLLSNDYTLDHFRQIRIKVLEGVDEIVNDVCAQAFEGLMTATVDRVALDPDYVPNGSGVFIPRPELVDNFPQNLPSSFTNLMREDLNTDLSEIFGGMRIIDGCETESDVHPDDRTIFLTFSKGYYVAENEIKEFFTRIFGDFIEGIYMQEVGPNEQPLYARMVARSSSVIPVIAPAGSKAKYSINGRHIWAKKYVKKNRGGASTSLDPNYTNEASTSTSNAAGTSGDNGENEA